MNFTTNSCLSYQEYKDEYVDILMNMMNIIALSLNDPALILNIAALYHPWHRDIAYKDVGTIDLSGTKIMTVHPEHRSSLPSMAPRHTVHPEHKKALTFYR
jgi:hypothetical protein